MKKTKLFVTGFFQVYFVSISTYFISKEQYLGVLVASFLISIIWSFNVKKVAFGTISDRIVYAIAASIGSVSGLFSSSFILNIFNNLLN